MTPKSLSKSYIGYLQRLVKNGLKQLHSILTPIRRKSSDHLVDDATKTPPIHCLSVSLLLYHLGGQILRSSTDGHRLLILIQQCLGQSEICELDVAGLIKQYIFRFEAK